MWKNFYWYTRAVVCVVRIYLHDSTVDFVSGDFLFVRVDSPVYTINTYGILEQHASCVHVPTSDATLTTNGGQTKTVTALLATPSLYPSASADTRDGAGLARGAALRVHACMYHKTKEEREK